jgi:diguanylate cyclase (GGDEF)-like protein/PAS domain S-box-containing protein
MNQEASPAGRSAPIGQREMAETFFEHSLNGLAILDRHYNYLCVNPAYALVCRRALGEFAGCNHFDLYPSNAKDVFDEVVRTRLPHVTLGRAFEFPGQPQRGLTYWDWTLVPVLGRHGEVEFLFFSVNEVTERKRAEQALRKSALEIEDLYNNAPCGYHSLDRRGMVVRINHTELRWLGYSAEEVVGKLKFTDLLAPSSRKTFEDIFPPFTQRESFMELEYEMLRKDGTTFPVLLNASVIRDSDGHFVSSRTMAYDITERKAAEAKIQRLSQIYVALSQCRQAILRCSNEEELFVQICRDAVQLGGVKLAWIGLVDESGKWVRPTAIYGVGVEYVDDIQISMDPDEAIGRGPAGIAIRERRPIWSNDFMGDPNTAPWQERAARFGWGTSAALPFFRNGAAIGAFLLYAHEVDAFDQATRNLLVEMTQDISAAMEKFEHEAARRRIEAALQISEENLNRAQSVGKVGSWHINILSGRLECSAEAYRMYGLPNTVKDLKTFAGQLHPGDREMVICTWAEAISRTFYEIEYRIVVEGQTRWLKERAQIYRDAAGQPQEAIGSVQDITERKNAEEHIQRLGHFDSLTGLPNRILLADRFNHDISIAQHSHGQLALLFIDLDHFKNVNDTLGHRIGDALLMDVARRMQAVVREEDTISRQGGDEFVIILPGIDADGAAHVAEKLLQTAKRPYHTEGHELSITPSIGIAIYPVDGKDFESLAQCADAAMYRAKRAGRNNFRFYTAEMQARSARIMQLESALRRALERGQLHLHYQPQVSLKDGRTVGAEALLRWTHPELGVIEPAEFIPIAEDSGLILPIGEWVLRTAVRQCKAWIESGLKEMTIAVNISAVQFRHPRLTELVMQILDEEKLPPQCLGLELTEGVAMDDPVAAIAVMDALHAHGIRMSIDDFGTGYSSLSYLKRFKVYKLKVDQSFVQDIAADSDDKAIVGAVISLADSLGLQTIAEGVETEEQLAFLRTRGCDEVQGFFFSKAVSAESFEAFARIGGVKQDY